MEHECWICEHQPDSQPNIARDIFQIILQFLFDRFLFVICDAKEERIFIKKWMKEMHCTANKQRKHHTNFTDSFHIKRWFLVVLSKIISHNLFKFFIFFSIFVYFCSHKLWHFKLKSEINRKAAPTTTDTNVLDSD